MRLFLQFPHPQTFPEQGGLCVAPKPLCPLSTALVDELHPKLWGLRFAPGSDLQCPGGQELLSLFAVLQSHSDCCCVHAAHGHLSRCPAWQLLQSWCVFYLEECQEEEAHEVCEVCEM